MKVISSIIAFAILLVIVSGGCKSNSNKKNTEIDAVDSTALLAKGDSIASAVQKVLLSHVMQAMKSGGPGFAIAFCNEKAMALTDSLGQVYNCTIQRITDRNRNPANRLSEDDAEIIASFPASQVANSRLVLQNQIPVYYKPIKIAMPACLGCHGTEGKDIEAKTLAIIRQKYPEDKATGYKEGDLRGWWKITFTAE